MMKKKYISFLGAKKFEKKEVIAAAIFLAPWLIGIFIFTLWPFLESIIMTFQKTNLRTSVFVGFDNYIDLLTDRKFIKSITVTFKYVVISVPLKLAFALFIAMLLKDNIKGVGLFRSALYLPSLIGTSVAVAAMWSQLFGNSGLINNVLEVFGIRGKAWISNPDTALYVLIILAIWMFGSSMVIFLSGLKNIPGTLYEAAEVDGATKIQSFIHITLPMLSPIILFNLVLQTINSFQMFTQAFIITKGGPLNETLFSVLHIYNTAFRNLEMGYASAMSWTLLFIIAITTGIIFLTSKFWVYYESE